MECPQRARNAGNGRQELGEVPLRVEMLKQTSKFLRFAAVTMRKEEGKEGTVPRCFLKEKWNHVAASFYRDAAFCVF